MQASEFNRRVDQVLRIEGVTKFFGDLQVLDHLDMTIGQQKTVGLIGPERGRQVNLVQHFCSSDTQLYRTVWAMSPG